LPSQCDLSAVKQLEDLLAGEMASRALVIAHQLGVFAALDSGPAQPAQLAQKLAVQNEWALAKLLNALVGLGLVTREADAFANSPLGQALVPLADQLPYYGDFVDFFADQYRVKSGERLFWHIKDNLPLRPQPTAHEWQTYMAAMACVARLSAARIARAVDLGDTRTLLDLAGGPGHYAVAFCAAYSSLEVTLYDLEPSLACAARNIERSPVRPRIRLMPGSATDPSFGGPYGAVFISHTIHLFDSAMVGKLLQRASNALEPGGQLIVRDFIMNRQKSSPMLGALIAFHLWLEGDAYSFDQVKQLLEDAGCRDVRLVEFCGPGEPAVLGSLVVARKC
jgi:SAM-dependent methyltransferase